MDLSIIIPIYNVEKYIRRCIESVMTQSVSGLGIECILVNDCTPDDSMRIVNEMIDSYLGPIQFVVLQHDKNRGLSAARNTGEAHAIAPFVVLWGARYLEKTAIGNVFLVLGKHSLTIFCVEIAFIVMAKNIYSWLYPESELGYVAGFFEIFLAIFGGWVVSLLLHKIKFINRLLF